jgi:hypothetical protein
MQILRKITVLLLLLFPFYGESQIDFYKLFTNNGYDFGQGIVQLEDSSYVITGYSSSFVEGASQAFLLKIDSLGNYIWSKDYGGLETDGGRRVLYQPGEGFYIAGHTNSIGAGGFDFYLIKTDLLGNVVWERTYGGTGWEKVNDAMLLADGGIMMVGQTNSDTPGDDNMYIVRTDADGNTLWTKTIGEGGDDVATSMRKFDNSTYIIGGQEYIEDSLMNKASLLSIDIDGTINWQYYYGDYGDYIINDLSISATDISIVGKRKRPSIDTYDTYGAKVSFAGIFSYETYDSNLADESYDLITEYGTSNNLYISFSRELAGVTYTDGKDQFISRFSSGLWWDVATIGIANTGDDIGGQLIKTNDGGAIIVGYNKAFGAGGNNVYVMKIGANDVFPVTYGTPSVSTLVGIYENQLETSEEFTVFPNPTNDIIHVSVPSNFEGEIYVKNIYGQIVSTFPKGQKSINVESLSQGNYFISIQSAEKGSCTKMISVY